MIFGEFIGWGGGGVFVLEKKGGQGGGFICICSIIVFVAATIGPISHKSKSFFEHFFGD